MFAILTRKIEHPELVWLTRTVLFHDPTTDYYFRSRLRNAPGPDSPHYPIPPHKSLFRASNQRGLPIGNLTSQFWGNVYLNELDQFIKRRLKCRYYLRYVDDMVLLAEDGGTLAAWCEAIERFLSEELKLSLRPEMTMPFPTRRGIDFVGWRTWWNHRLPRRRTLANLENKLDGFERTAFQKTLGGMAQRVDLRRREADGTTGRLCSMLASYGGHLKHGAALKAWEEIWKRRRWLAALLERRKWSFDERWSSRRLLRARNFHSRYWRLTCSAGEHSLVFFQVGRFIEFYGPQRLLATRLLGLRPAAIHRGRFALVAGFPAHLPEVYFRRAIGQGVGVVALRRITEQVGCVSARLLPCALLIPAATGTQADSPK